MKQLTEDKGWDAPISSPMPAKVEDVVELADLPLAGDNVMYFSISFVISYLQFLLLTMI